MINSSFYSFLFTLIFKHKTKHISIFIISTLLVFVLSSVIFVSSSLKQDIDVALDAQSDFVVQAMKAGERVDIPLEYADDFIEILGVSVVTPRVYGKYFYEPLGKYFTIIGVDLFSEQANEQLEQLLGTIDIKAFRAKESMIIGKGVKSLLEKFRYTDFYRFRLAFGGKKDLAIYNVMPTSTTLISNDMVLMNIDLAREILGVHEEYATDIILNVSNELERDNVSTQLILNKDNIRVIRKDEIKKQYDMVFNYKGGIFLILYIVVIMTFLLIIYQRYSMIQSSDKKEIGILKAVGFSIKDILKLKILENFIVAITSFMLGILLAFAYVYFMNAPLLQNIFLGFSNLDMAYNLTPSFDTGLFITLFIFYIVPFLSAILFPVWKIATIDAIESMK